MGLFKKKEIRGPRVQDGGRGIARVETSHRAPIIHCASPSTDEANEEENRHSIVLELLELYYELLSSCSSPYRLALGPGSCHLITCPRAVLEFPRIRRGRRQPGPR